MHMYTHTPALRNNGDGTFTEGTRDAGLGLEENGMGLAVADVDNDGLLDVFVTSIFAASWKQRRETQSPFGHRGNFLYRNLGGRKFSVVDTVRPGEEVNRVGSLSDAGWAWGAAWLDSNNDGILELVTANGYSIPETTFDDG